MPYPDNKVNKEVKQETDWKTLMKITSGGIVHLEKRKSGSPYKPI